MNQNEKVKLAVRFGLSHEHAKALIAQLDAHTERYRRGEWDRDFDAIIAPLSQQIKTIAASRTRWQHDAVRYALYAPYLALMRKTRDKLKRIARTALKEGKTIREAALEHGVTEFDGRRWSAWIPMHIRSAFMLEFQKLPGRKVTPFLSVRERTTNERRWELLVEKVVGLQAVTPPDSELYPYLDRALTIARQRTSSAPAPRQWVHILPSDDRVRINVWRKRTLGGVREGADDGTPD